AVVLDPKERQPVTAMVALLAGVTDARRGELCGLRWTDVDAERHPAEDRPINPAWTGQDHPGCGLDQDGPGATGGPRRTHRGPVTDYRRQAERWATQARVALAQDGYILTPDPTGCTPLNPD